MNLGQGDVNQINRPHEPFGVCFAPFYHRERTASGETLVKGSGGKAAKLAPGSLKFGMYRALR